MFRNFYNAVIIVAKKVEQKNGTVVNDSFKTGNSK